MKLICDFCGSINRYVERSADVMNQAKQSKENFEKLISKVSEFKV